jgi:hypothetical protein
MTCGLATGLTVSAVTPILPSLIGFSSLSFYIVPFIAVGNMALVTLWHFIGNRKIGGTVYITYSIALITGAVAKFLILFIGVTQLAVPIILRMEEPQASIISATFSYPQLITASTGGVCAIILLPLLLKAVKERKS